MNPNQKTLWTNPVLQEMQANAIGLFPADGCHESRGLPKDLIEALQTKPDQFYEALIETLGALVEKEFHLPNVVTQTLARDSVVVIGYVLLDRILRVWRLLDSNPHSALVVAKARDDLKLPRTLQELGVACSDSQEFNQFILEQIALVWSIPVSVEARPTPPTPHNIQSGQPALPQRKPLLKRVWQKLFRMFSSRWGRIPTGELAYPGQLFLQKNLFGPGRLAYLKTSLPVRSEQVNDELRKQFAQALTSTPSCREAWRALWQSLGIQDPALLESGLSTYCNLLLKLYPADRLEASAQNYQRASNLLGRFKSSTFFFSGMADTQTLYLLAATKGKGGKTIGIQHGVHYGIVDAPSFRLIEYPHCNMFVTWGNSVQISDNTLHRPQLKPLPTPWLSEKRKNWHRLTQTPDYLKRPKRFDAILPTDRLHHFPPSVTTLRMSRPDLMEETRAWLREVVTTLTQAQLHVLHKPFNQNSLALLGELPSKLLAESDGRYTIYDHFAKGLTPELITQGMAVVWDEPGSGFFECMVSNIPTLLYWPRMVYAETKAVQSHFDLLASVGVLHKSMDSLTQELLNLKNDPQAWMQNTSRVQAIEQVCHELANCSDDWQRIWLNFIRTS